MKISSAAILYQGKIFTGDNHFAIISEMSKISPPLKRPFTSAMQGFVTDNGEFVNRNRAAQIALESKQIDKLDHPPALYSEDLNKNTTQPKGE